MCQPVGHGQRLPGPCASDDAHWSRHGLRRGSLLVVQVFELLRHRREVSRKGVTTLVSHFVPQASTNHWPRGSHGPQGARRRHLRQEGGRRTNPHLNTAVHLRRRLPGTTWGRRHCPSALSYAGGCSSKAAGPSSSNFAGDTRGRRQARTVAQEMRIILIAGSPPCAVAMHLSFTVLPPENRAEPAPVTRSWTTSVRPAARNL